jgi:hypothetical protein
MCVCIFLILRFNIKSVRQFLVVDLLFLRVSLSLSLFASLTLSCLFLLLLTLTGVWKFPRRALARLLAAERKHDFSCRWYKDRVSRFLSSVEHQPAAVEEYQHRQNREKEELQRLTITILLLAINLIFRYQFNRQKMLREFILLLCATSAVLAIPRKLSISIYLLDVTSVSVNSF